MTDDKSSASKKIWVSYPAQPAQLKGTGCRLAYVWGREVSVADCYVRADLIPTPVSREAIDSTIRDWWQMTDGTLSALTNRIMALIEGETK